MVKTNKGEKERTRSGIEKLVPVQFLIAYLLIFGKYLLSL